MNLIAVVDEDKAFRKQRGSLSGAGFIFVDSFMIESDVLHGLKLRGIMCPEGCGTLTTSTLIKLIRRVDGLSPPIFLWDSVHMAMLHTMLEENSKDNTLSIKQRAMQIREAIWLGLHKPAVFRPQIVNLRGI